VPQAQLPSEAQLFALSGSQLTHPAPCVPQLASEGVLHCPLAQQPDGQESASQTQPLAEQRCPARHAAPPRQAQAPAVEHPSARTGSQLTQDAPPTPQASCVGVTVQFAPEQHPLQFVVQSLQEPALQVAEVVQAWQGAPPLPQAALSVPDRQLVPAQQPVQEAASQMHTPCEQRRPSPQGCPVPQWQAPLRQ
jgi:hypothetical protein